MKTAEEFIREKIREKQEIKGEMHALWKYQVSGEDCLKWSHEYANQFKVERDSLKEQVEVWKKQCSDTRQLVTDLKSQLSTLQEQNERLLQNTESQKQTFNSLIKKYMEAQSQSDKLAEALDTITSEVNCVLSHSDAREQEDKYTFMINSYNTAIEALSAYKQSNKT